MDEPRYLATAPGALVVVALDSLTAVYHRASGITHLLDSPAPEILATLRAPMTAAALLTRLGELYALGDPDPAALGARLDELAGAGLVTRL